LAHLQNVRARYRLRLNFDTDLYPKLSFHGQLATAQSTSSYSGSDFGSTTARHPSLSNEAWIDYHPTTRSLFRLACARGIRRQLTLPLLTTTFALTASTRSICFHSRKNAGYLTSIELRAGQYILTNPNVAVIAPGSPLRTQAR